jgi:hypothetical protein
LSTTGDVYLHVDKKADLAAFGEYRDKVCFVEPRIDVRWGGYSQIECMLALLDAAKRKDFDYVCLISGDDLPLKSRDDIKEFFRRNNGKEFIGVQKEYDRAYIEFRIKYEHSELQYKKGKNALELLLLKLRHLLRLNKVNRYYKMLPPLYYGSQWFCISRQMTDYIFAFLDENRWYKSAFERSYCADEHFFQTIVMNSPFRDRVYNYDTESDNNRMALRYIDWDSGPQYPKILTEDDLPKIKNTDCIFGRKFAENLSIARYKSELGIK